MREIAPSYYKNFKCLGSKCKHNCCIGWEIDIDPDTLKKYEKAEGVFKKRFESSISKDGENAHFILDKEERCPFLNKDGLCDIIIEYGESHLCEICSAHPRFKNFFSDRVEIGLGLSCEEACRIILTSEEPFILEEIKKDPSCVDNLECNDEIIKRRDEILWLFDDDTIVFFNEVIDRTWRESASIPPYFLSDWADILMELEIMSDEWRNVLKNAMECGVPLTIDDYLNEWKNLYQYFIYRYFANSDFDYAPRIKMGFCLLSSCLITTLCAYLATSYDDVIEITRLYSQEIEYSTENVRFLMDMIKEYNEK